MGSASSVAQGYWGRRLFSLSGVVPLGVFVVIYLWTTANAMRGREAFDTAMAGWTEHPFAWMLPVFGFWLPLAYHGGYGMKVLLASRPNVVKYPQARNTMYLLQRVSALVLLVFVAAHTWRFGFGVAAAPSADHFGKLCGDLSRTHLGLPFVAAGYLVGLAALVFHLSNGLYGFCRTWGIVVNPRAGNRLAGWFGVLGIVLYVVSASTVVYFATGASLMLSPSRVGVAAQNGDCAPPSREQSAVGANGRGR